MQITDSIRIGAIRWDGNAGFETNEVGAEEERVLSPSEWEYRVPFFAERTPSGAIHIREDSQDIMDRQIAYANDAGLDFWAFCHYDPDHYLSDARKLYANSTDKGGLKMSLILQGPDNDRIMDDIVHLAQQPYFQTVPDGRPLLFTYGCKTGERMEALQARLRGAGLQGAYIAVMDYGAAQTGRLCRQLGGHALSQYTGLAQTKDETYEIFRTSQERVWNDMLDTDFDIVPWVNIAWDPRPRIGCIPPYRFAPSDCYDGNYSWGSAQEYAAHILSAKRFIQSNPGKCPARTIISYSWNEYSEGGTLCPKRSGDRRHLDALKSAVKTI
jgi:hypothetical protein